MYGHILIATDGSEYSEKAVFEGVKLAKALGSKVTVVTAVQTAAPLIVEGKIMGPGLDERKASAKSKAKSVLDAAAKIASQVNVPVETEGVLNETPYDAIIETAKKRVAMSL